MKSCVADQDPMLTSWDSHHALRPTNIKFGYKDKHVFRHNQLQSADATNYENHDHSYDQFEGTNDSKKNNNKNNDNHTSTKNEEDDEDDGVRWVNHRSLPEQPQDSGSRTRIPSRRSSSTAAEQKQPPTAARALKKSISSLSTTSRMYCDRSSFRFPRAPQSIHSDDDHRKGQRVVSQAEQQQREHDEDVDGSVNPYSQDSSTQSHLYSADTIAPTSPSRTTLFNAAIRTDSPATRQVNDDHHRVLLLPAQHPPQHLESLPPCASVPAQQSNPDGASAGGKLLVACDSVALDHARLTNEENGNPLQSFQHSSTTPWEDLQLQSTTISPQEKVEDMNEEARKRFHQLRVSAAGMDASVRRRRGEEPKWFNPLNEDLGSRSDRRHSPSPLVRRRSYGQTDRTSTVYRVWSVSQKQRSDEHHQYQHSTQSSPAQCNGDFASSPARHSKQEKTRDYNRDDAEIAPLKPQTSIYEERAEVDTDRDPLIVKSRDPLYHGEDPSYDRVTSASSPDESLVKPLQQDGQHYVPYTPSRSGVRPPITVTAALDPVQETKRKDGVWVYTERQQQHRHSPQIMIPTTTGISPAASGGMLTSRSQPATAARSVSATGQQVSLPGLRSPRFIWPECREDDGSKLVPQLSINQSKRIDMQPRSNACLFRWPVRYLIIVPVFVLVLILLLLQCFISCFLDSEMVDQFIA